MITPYEIPINSLAWLFGSVACLALGIKSFLAYRDLYNQLAKYIYWFSFIMAAALFCFAIPLFFTLDLNELRYVWIVGELLVYTSLIPQAAILWALTLRSRVSVYIPTIATALIGYGAWIYAAPRISIYTESSFIGYSEPGISTFTMAFLFSVLFLPVGFHFMKATLRQTEFKARLMTFVLGMVYVGTGVSTASHLLFIGQVSNATSSIGNMAFFTVLFVAIVWPKRAKVKTPAVAMYGHTSH